MKILRLEIQNLASIPNAVIDFDKPPLVNEPLFLISGETGAGKSTILDAICLALYAKTPRFETIDGEELNSEIKKTDDERNILRKGTTKGFASVDFKANDGNIYRCIWSVAYSRAKSGGKMQAVKRELLRYSGDEFISITDKKKEIEASIKSLVGLDFNQFIRTALLAQNQFAKFLQAASDDKASILEILTDTGIYTKISQRIFERYKIEKTLLDDSRKKMGEIKLLTPEELNDYNQQREEILKEQNSLNASLNQVTQKLQWLTVNSKLTNDIQQLTKENNEAKEAQKQIGKKRVRQQLIIRANSEIKTIVDNVAQLTFEIEEYNTKKNELLELLSKYFVVLEQLNLDWENNETELKKVNKWLADNEKFSSLVENSQTILTRIADVENNTKKIKKAQTDLKTLENRKDNTTEEFYKIKNENESFAKALTEAETAYSEKLKLEQEIDANALQTERQSLDEENKSLLNLKIVLTQLYEKKSEVEKLKSEITENESNLKALSDALPKLQKAKYDAEKEYELCDEIYKRQQLIVSADISAIRAQLKDGTPCPVCGSVHHEWSSEKTFDDVLKVAEQKRSAAEAKKIAANNTLTENETNRKSLTKSLDKQRKILLPPIEKSVADLISESNVEISKLGIIKENALEDVNKRLVSIDEKIAKNNASQKQLSELRKQTIAAQKDLKKAQQTKGTSDEALAKIKEQCTSIDANIKSQNKVIEDRNHDIKNVLNEIKNLIKIPELFAKLQKNTIKFKSDFQNYVKQYNETTEKKDILSRTNEDLSATINSCKERLNDIKQILPSMPNEAADYLVKTSDKSNLANNLTTLFANLKNLNETQQRNSERINIARQAVEKWLKKEHLEASELKSLLSVSDDERKKTDEKIRATDEKVISSERALNDKLKEKSEHDKSEYCLSEEESEKSLISSKNIIDEHIKTVTERLTAINVELKKNEDNIANFADKQKQIEKQNKICINWSRLNEIFGSADGKKMRLMAQSYTLKMLLNKANEQLKYLSDKYCLLGDPSSLAILVYDYEMGGEPRPASTLSGGESFIVSLALALGLAAMMQNNIQIGTLFIDEGFGTLDEHCLQTVMGTLGHLHTQGRQVGIISHVSQLSEKISTQIQVIKSKTDNTRSEVRVVS